MAVLELYGKCKELGYCDCRGFFGCVDDGVKPKPDSDALKAAARQHETKVSENDVKRYADAMPEDLTGSLDHTLVDCEVCDRSHRPNHPHIANIEGDTPIDAAWEVAIQDRAIASAEQRELPNWLQDQLEGERRSYATKRTAANCDDCGKIKRSNHKCKGKPQAAPVEQKTVECEDCKASGELCVRHGGRWADYETPRGHDECIARQLPKPTPVIVPDPQPQPDQELTAIGTILKAVDGLGANQLKRVMNYVAARLEEGE
jgi:hypothetical protein